VGRRTRFKQARDFIVYYGKCINFSDHKYDIVVIEPNGYSSVEINQIQDTRTIILAYVSFLEIPPWSDVLRFLEADDFLQVNREKVLNTEYGNYCANLNSARWQSILLNRVSTLLSQKSYDGLFIDTIGFLENKQLPDDLRNVQIRASYEIISKIRAIYPDHIFVQNCGLFEVIKSTHKLIDGICWENPPLEFEDDWVHYLLDNLSALQNNSGLKVFFLLENTKIQSLRYTKVLEQALKRKFLFYNAVNGYTEHSSCIHDGGDKKCV